MKLVTLELPPLKEEAYAELLKGEKVYVKNFKDDMWKGPYTMVEYEKSFAMPYCVEHYIHGPTYFKYVELAS
jgi:hypothetical protein